MKIKVEPLFPTGNYLNVRIGIEKDFPEDTNEMEAVFSIWDNIIAMHMKRYPHLYNEDGTAKYEMYKGEDDMRGTKVRTVEEPQDKIKAWVEVMSSAASVKALERFKQQIDRENNEELTAMYKKKHLELSK